MTAARRSRATVMTYGILSNTPAFSPNVFVDIAATFHKKKAALKEHHSQAERPYMSDEYLDIFARSKYAALRGIALSECFHVERMFL
jgi:LmbE family N-acetylglucosaminyl deacetylase